MEHNGGNKKERELMIMKKRLIEEIRKYPNLYDPKHDAYRNMAIKDRSWLEIAKTLNQNAEFLKREWKKLRDGYRQARRKAKTKNSRSECVWRFEKSMSYLLPFMSERMSDANEISASETITKDSNISITDTEEEEDAYVEMEQDLDEPLKIEDTAAYWDPPPSHSPTLDDSRVKAIDQSDDLDLFFSSLCQSTRKLPRKYQNKIKKGLLEVVTKVEEEYYIDNNI